MTMMKKYVLGSEPDSPNQSIPPLEDLCAQQSLDQSCTKAMVFILGKVIDKLCLERAIYILPRPNDIFITSFVSWDPMEPWIIGTSPKQVSWIWPWGRGEIEGALDTSHQKLEAPRTWHIFLRESHIHRQKKNKARSIEIGDPFHG